MIKINDLNLCKILVNVKPDETKSNGKEIKIGISGWQNMTMKELNEINQRRIDNDDYNQYYIKLNREYMVFDTDSEYAYKQLCNYLIINDLYYEGAITKSFKGKTKNIYYNRHFWFKVNNQRQFKHIKEEGQIKFGNRGGECFFGNNAYIGEFKNTYLLDIQEIDVAIYNDIIELLSKPEPVLKSKSIDKVYIVDSEDEEEPAEEEPAEDEEEQKIKVIKPAKINKSITQVQQTSNNITNEEIFKIIDGLNKKRYDEYEYWLIAYFIFCNENLDKEIFKYFSKKTTKIYNEYNNDKLLKNIIPKKGYTISTLYFWLKEDNYELFKEMCKTRNDFWKLQLNNISIADFYYQLNPESYVYTYTSGWYEYNENNILVHRGEIPISLSNGMGRRLQEIATEQRNFITPDNLKYKEYMDFYNKFFNKVGSNDFIKSVIEQMKQLYYVDISEKINNINLLAFNNILYDYSNNLFRKINKLYRYLN